MGKFLFKWFVEVPAAMHVWIQLAVWLLAGGNFVYMAFKGVEVHVLIAIGLLGVGGAALIGNHLPPLLARWSEKHQFHNIALILEELHAVGRDILTTGEASEVWAEMIGDEKGSIRRYLKFRRIKRWVDEGALSAKALNGSSANLKTTIETSEIAAFFRRGCK